MDSTEVTVKTAAAAAAAAGNTVQSSNSPPVQESPFSNFLHNLSPIEPVKAQHVSQGFLGLNSPLAFTSPRINALREASSLKRLVADTQKDSDMKKFAQVQPDIYLGNVGEYLADRTEVDCANSTTYEVNPDLEQSVDLLQSSLKNNFKESQQRSKLVVHCHLMNAIPSNLFIDLASKKQECGISAQNEGSVHEGKSACHPQLLPEPFHIAQTYEDSEENAGAIVLHGLVDTTMHDTEV
ncbi:hypothetical protein EZV62_013680 [Acer yangbiense]|uniref:Uncharacterized protein n=1 Tax=Acer yangbiense TaxID=1000413 RepID=A0A5C7HZ05_9ROSI|nr:hypothetical protein EZV62_013680 [Acer yangbiense]